MSETAPQKTVLLGEEYDEKLREAVRTVLRASNARLIDKRWGVGGSQEIETVEAEIDGQIIVVESETFIGLTISGATELVDQIAEKIRQVRATMRE